MKLKPGKKAISLATALTLLLGVITAPGGEYSVSAASSTSITDKQDKIKDLENRNKEIDNEMSQIDGDITENEELQDLAFEKLNNAKEQVDNYNNLLYYKEQDIDTKQAEINNLDIQIEAKEKDIEKYKRSGGGKRKKSRRIRRYAPRAVHNRKQRYVLCSRGILGYIRFAGKNRNDAQYHGSEQQAYERA